MIFLLKRLLCVCVLALSISTQAKPLGETTATVLSAVGGAVVGGAAGVGTYYLSDDVIQNNTMRLVVSGLVGAGAGGLTWYLLNQWLYSKTPTARIAAASLLVSHAVYQVQKIEKNLEASFEDKVVAKKFSSDKDFIANINARFGTSWPLVLAREYLTNLPGSYKNSISSVEGFVAGAKDPLNTALAEMRSSSGYSALIAEGERLNDVIKQVLTQCEQLKQQVCQFAEVIEVPLTTIVQQEDFRFQVDLYEKHEEAERQRRYVEAEAARRRAHELALQANDHAHDSWARLSDQSHDSVERQRDRFSTSLNNERKYQHQNTVLYNNPYRPVTLNVG